MSQPFKPLDLSGVKTYPLSQRNSIVSTSDFAKIWQKGCSFKDFMDSLPDILAGNQIKAVVAAIANAYQKKKTVLYRAGCRF